MRDSQKQQILDGQGEDILQELFDEAADAKSEALWNAYQAELEAGTAPEIPEELDAKCQELIRSSAKKGKKIQFRKFIGIGLKNVAIITVVLIALVSTAVVSVDAIRIPVLKLLVEDRERYSTIFFNSSHVEKDNVAPSDKVLSTRLPIGYVLESVQERQNISSVYQFIHEEGSIIQVTIRPSDSMIDFDTEDAEPLSTTIYDWPAIYIEKKGHRIIWFNSDLNYIFDVHATNLSESDFWEYIYRLAK